MNLPRWMTACCGALALAALGRAPAFAQEPPSTPAGTAPAQGAGAASGLSMPGTRPVDVIRAQETPPARPADAARATTDAARAAADKPPPKAPTDFQQFAATSVGAVLPVYGQELFSSPPSTFAAVEDLPPAADYLIGPGDELVVRGWGQVEIDVRATVSREGTLNLPRIGAVSVAGTRFSDLAGLLKQAVGRYYRNFELTVSLGRLRSIQVFVVGHAQKPGLYTVGSLSTLMNALFASGGPSSTGSMRRIQLRRGDKQVAEFDLYDLLLKGDKSKDARLQSGDVIFVPPAGPLAAIAGRVKTQAVFELKPDCTLADLIGYAGGLSTTAATQSVLIEHLDQRLGRIEQELPWGDASLATHLRDGDVVLLRTLSQRFDNAVTLRGQVAFPVRTAWKDGLTVADLIPDRTVLIPESYWARVASRSLDIGALDPAALRTTIDEVNWDYAVVERLDRSTLAPRLLPFNLAKAVIDRDPAENLKLEAGDIVTVFSRRDIAVPAEKRTYLVRIEGEVAIPGVYQVAPGATLRQLVERAGGLTKSAYLFGAEFSRESVRRDQQLRLEEVAARAEQELERSAAERLARASSGDEASATRAQIDQQRRTITRLRSLRPSGRMVLNLDPGISSAQGLPDLTLEDGDRFQVPFRSSTVGVYGAVYNQGNFLYRPDRKLDDYLDQAGGPTRAADDGSTYVLRADGSVISRRQTGIFGSFGGRVLMPSDNIVVPEEFQPFSLIRELKDWSQIFYQFGLGVAAIRVLAQ